MRAVCEKHPGLRQFANDLEGLVSGLQAAHGEVAVIATGSRARGDWTQVSDLDVLVVSDRFAGVRPPDRIGMVWEHWKALTLLEPVCLTFEEFRRCVGIAVWDALEFGIVLCGEELIADVREQFQAGRRAGELVPTETGWRGKV